MNAQKHGPIARYRRYRPLVWLSEVPLPLLTVPRVPNWRDKNLQLQACPSADDGQVKDFSLLRIADIVFKINNVGNSRAVNSDDEISVPADR